MYFPLIYLCFGILVQEFSIAHKHDKSYRDLKNHCPKGNWKRAGPNLCIQLDHGDPDDLQGALEHCRDWTTGPINVKRDENQLITVQNLLEILSQPARYFNHEIWINAVLYEQQWYQIMKVPESFKSALIKDYIDAGYAEPILEEDMDKLDIAGLSQGKHFGTGDSLVFNPKSNRAFKRVNGEGKFSYTCVHQL